MPDEAAAREHAIEDARYLLQHSMTAEGGWRIEVADEHGRVLFVIPFTAVADAGETDEPTGDE